MKIPAVFGHAKSVNKHNELRSTETFPSYQKRNITRNLLLLISRYLCWLGMDLRMMLSRKLSMLLSVAK